MSVRTSGSDGAWSGRWAAALVLLAGLVAVAVRPALPVDETRYLEILRESAGPWLLTLEGEPYADKPPLLFWIARMAGWLGLPAAVALRAVPAFASAATVLAVGRIARRIGVANAGWLQAALLAPLLYTQFLLFDPLLTAGVWWAAAGWVEGRNGVGALASAVALLAKGPVALLFLAPLAWAVGPLVAGRGRARLAGIAAGLVPLVAWALLAAATAGDLEFQRHLLWERWAGRVHESFAHRRPFWFYVPILLVGALPATGFLASRAVRAGDAAARRFVARLGATLIAVLVAFSAFSGKQPHYLLPLFPIVALHGAWQIAHAPRAVGRLAAGTLAHALLLVALVAVGLATEERWLARYGERADLVRGSIGWDLGWLVAGVGALGNAAWQAWGASSPRDRLVASVLGTLAVAAPLHAAAGRLVVPHDLARRLAATPREAPLALVGGSMDGLYALLAGRERLDRIGTRAELVAWCGAHPDGLLIARERDLASFDGLDLELVLRDRVNGHPRCLMRVTAPAQPRSATGR